MTCNCIENRIVCRNTCSKNDCICCCWFFHCGNLNLCPHHQNKTCIRDKHRSNKCSPSQCDNPNINRCRPFSIYSKGLTHDENGYVDVCTFNKYYKALKKKAIAKLDCIPHNELKQCDTGAVWSYDDCRIPLCDILPKINTPEYATNLIEVYAMAHVRDVAFCDFETDTKITEAINCLNELSETSNLPDLEPEFIFRGFGCGDETGPYISQFLYLDYMEGNSVKEQKYQFYEPTDFMTTFANTVDVQNGIVNENLVAQLPNKYITNGRELAYYLHMFEPFQTFYHSALVLESLNVPPNPCLPNSENIKPFVNFGFADIISSLNAVIRPALLASWCFKNRTLFLRPEVGGLITERTRLNPLDNDNPEISIEILDNSILDEFLVKNNNHLLPQVYPEGAPLTPGFPSYYAVLAGAQSTILKFFYDCNGTLDLVKPSADGLSLVDVVGLSSDIYGELNKLASNLALGRVWAGVSYRLAAESGILLGEKVALEFLKQHVLKYPQKINVYLKLYDGCVTVVSNC